MIRTAVWKRKEKPVISPHSCHDPWKPANNSVEPRWIIACCHFGCNEQIQRYIRHEFLQDTGNFQGTVPENKRTFLQVPCFLLPVACKVYDGFIQKMRITQSASKVSAA